MCQSWQEFNLEKVDDRVHLMVVHVWFGGQSRVHDCNKTSYRWLLYSWTIFTEPIEYKIGSQTMQPKFISIVTVLVRPPSCRVFDGSKSGLEHKFLYPAVACATKKGAGAKKSLC